MELEKLKGKYVIAVSGGVDSVVLLDVLVKQQINNSRLEMVVAHLDHGIRSESKEDRIFVEELSKKYGLKFYYSEGKLGHGAGEQKAREARYDFLNKVVAEEKVDALFTAHHQDDRIETAILNIIRGTGRKGITSLSSSTKILRPLLNYPKSDILKYALDNDLTWHEDKTNSEYKYLRNNIRHNIIPKLDCLVTQSSKVKALYPY